MPKTWYIAQTIKSSKLTLNWINYYTFLLCKIISINPYITPTLINSLVNLTKTLLITVSLGSEVRNDNNLRLFTKPTVNFTQKKALYLTPLTLNDKMWRVQEVTTALNLTLFYHFLKVTTTSWVRNFKTHAAFRLMFIHYQYGSANLINVNSGFKRWRNNYLFLFNLFYTSDKLPTFGSRVFKTEILALNWSFNLLSFNLFKFSSPFFLFNDEAYGFNPLMVLKKWKKKNINYVFLLELKIFKKLHHFFKTLGTFIIGLVPMTTNPWLVSYPIPAFSDTKLIQYYFLKLITFIRQDATQLKFKNYYSLWIS